MFLLADARLLILITRLGYRLRRESSIGSCRYGLEQRVICNMIFKQRKTKLSTNMSLSLPPLLPVMRPANIFDKYEKLHLDLAVDVTTVIDQKKYFSQNEQDRRCWQYLLLNSFSTSYSAFRILCTSCSAFGFLNTSYIATTLLLLCHLGPLHLLQGAGGLLGFGPLPCRPYLQVVFLRSKIQLALYPWWKCERTKLFESLLRTTGPKTNIQGLGKKSEKVKVMNYRLPLIIQKWPL